MTGGFNRKSHQGSRSNRGKVVTVAIVGATAPSRDGLGLVHLWLVRIIIDIVLTLRRNQCWFKTERLLVSVCSLTESRVLTVGRWMIELLEVTVCSPSCIMAISLLLSSEASAKLLTELLWELAEMDILGTDWELSMLLTVPVRSRYCSTSCTHDTIAQ